MNPVYNERLIAAVEHFCKKNPGTSALMIAWDEGLPFSPTFVGGGETDQPTIAMKITLLSQSLCALDETAALLKKQITMLENIVNGDEQ